MTVSVVIPTYNAARFIAGTLASVYAQTAPPLEVIVADDASPDGTADIVAQLAAAAPVPVRVVRLPRNTGGPAGPLNAGIAAAAGELIAPLDHDDAMRPDKLARQAAALRAAPAAGLAFHHCQAVGPDGAVLDDEYARRVAGWLAAAPKSAAGPDAWRIERATAYTGLAGLNYAQSCSGLLFLKSVWREVGGFHAGFRAACDWEFLQRVTARYDLVYQPDPLVRWLRHPGSFTFTAGDSRGLREHWRVLTRVRPRLLAPGGRPAWRAEVADTAGQLRALARALRRRGDWRQAAAVHLALARGRPGAAAAVAAKDLARPLARAAGLARPAPPRTP